MQIMNEELRGLVADATKIATIVGDSLKGKKWEKVHKNFSDIVGWLPEYDEDAPQDKEIFVKQKVMRKVQKRWYAATMVLYKSSNRKNLKVSSDYWAVQHAVVIAAERMGWIEMWMIDEITRQLMEDDPELEDLWEEEKNEFGYDLED